MNDIYIAFSVGTFTISRVRGERIPTQNRDYIFARFAFSSVWDGLTKIAIFAKEGLEAVHVPIENGVCKIPNVFMEVPGTIEVSVFAGDRRTVNTAAIAVIQSGYQESIPATDPGPDSTYVQSPGGSVPFLREEGGVLQYFARDAWQPVDIAQLAADVAQLQAEATAKWMLLNDIEVRTRNNAAAIRELQEAGRE